MLQRKMAKYTANARALACPRVVNIYDLRSLARRRVPKIVFNYIDGGAEGELTRQENRRAFDAITFRRARRWRLRMQICVCAFSALTWRCPCCLLPSATAASCIPAVR
jgi:hypothetical protein